jgi:alpha-glucosidase
MVRPTFYDFPGDPRCYDENDDLMVGSALLAAPVVEPGYDRRSVYLPSGADWYDFWSGEVFAGGQWVTLPAPPTRPPLLARACSVIAINRAEQHFAKPADARGFHIFPHRGHGAFLATSFEDDAESDAYLRDAFCEWTLTVDCRERIHIGLARAGTMKAQDNTVHFILPATETRAVELSGAQLAGETRTSEGRVIAATLQP